MAKSYVGTFIKVALIVAIPVAALAWVSSSSAKGPTGGGSPTPKPADEIPKKIKAWADKWLAGPGSEPADDGPKPVHVGWFFYAGRWILIEEYTDPAPEITDQPDWVMGPLAREFVYKSRFRWTVMHDGSSDSPPLAMGDATGQGEGHPVEDARMAAAQVAADAAAAWIDTFNQGAKS